MQSLRPSSVFRASQGFVCSRCLRSAGYGLSARGGLQKSVTAFRAASTSAAPVERTDLDELEQSSHQAPFTSEEWDPAEQARRRKKQLPPSSYQVRPPKYYRGPLHPHQPPKPSNPISREYIPGPFSFPRLQQTYESTVAPDYMVLTYQHKEPGAEPAVKGPRLRSWDEDLSPYNKNRGLRGPRGGSRMRLLRKPITFRNIPHIQRVTVHCYANKVATDGSGALHVAGMALQAITSVRPKTFATKRTIADWGIKSGKYIALTADMGREASYDFLARVIDLVLPRVKDWKGVPATSGDGSGNITFGLEPNWVAYFPEIEVNYDAYPSKLIPGAHITIHTSAANDRDARLLLTGMGLPFDGNINHF